MRRATSSDGNAEERRILDSIRVLVREIRASSTASEQAIGLSAAQLFVLRMVAREPGLSVNALAERTLTHQSSVSVVVAKLEAAGYLARSRSPTDARRLVVRATPAGAALAARSADPIQERFVASLARLPAATRRRLSADLARWVAALGVDAAEPEMFYEPKRRG